MNLIHAPHARSRAFATALIVCALASAPGQALAAEPSRLNAAERHVTCTELSSAAQAYYQGDYTYEKLAQLPGAADASTSYNAAQNNELFDALQQLMSSTATYNPSYSGFKKGSLAYYWNNTDTTPSLNNSAKSHFLLFYSDVPYEYPGASVEMSREHVWPKSLASFQESGGGSDLHHLRPESEDVNKTRGNFAFGEVDEATDDYDMGREGKQIIYLVSNRDELFEPKDDVKGDVARILLYVYCRWDQPNLYSDVSRKLLPSLDSDDNKNTGQRVVESLDTLLSWCALDPVDTWEMERNDIAQQVQGNRNVFIDYPELAWRLFGRTVPDNLQSPTSAQRASQVGATEQPGDPQGQGEGKIQTEPKATEPQEGDEQLATPLAGIGLLLLLAVLAAFLKQARPR